MMRRPSLHPRSLFQCALLLLATAAIIVHGLTTPPPLFLSSSDAVVAGVAAVSKSSTRHDDRRWRRRRRRLQNNFVVLGAAANNQETTSSESSSSSSSTSSSLVPQSAVKSQLFSAFTNLALTDQYDAVLTGLAAKILDSSDSTPERTITELSNCYELLTEMNQKRIAPSPRSTMAMIDVRIFCFLLAACVCLFVSLLECPLTPGCFC
jgi:hypothetical protein